MEQEKRLVYYKTTKKIELPKNSQWRYWKFALPSGEWKLFRGIKNLRELRDLLVKFNPEAFYYSTSEFLSTERPEEPNYMVADQLFLQNQYLVIDIDNRFGTPQVKKSAWQVIDIMKKFKDIYLLENSILTGRGCRLEFKDLTTKPELLPYEKEQWVKETRKEFMLSNLSQIPDVDHVIAWDTRRVIKCIGSPNPHNDFVTQKLMSVSYLPAIPGPLVNEAKGQDPSCPRRELGGATDQESGNPLPYPIFFGKFIRNKVEGTKDRFVPYFEYNKRYKNWADDLKFLQEKFGLSDLYIVDDNFKVCCIGIDAVPAPRLDKIYRQSESLTKSTWKKFRNLYIRTSAYFNGDLKKIEEHNLKPLFKIDNSKHKVYPISKPHIDFLNFVGFNTGDLNESERLVIGNEKNKIYETYFEDRELKWT